MTRPYFQVYGPNTYTKAKWKRAPMVVRGALLTLWIQSSMQRDEGYWPSRAELEADLDADGCPEVSKVVDRLIELRWIDCTPDGCVVHEWSEWQAAMKFPSDSTEATRERKRRQRERERHSHDVTVTSHDVTAIGEERRGIELSPDGDSKSSRNTLDPAVWAFFKDHEMVKPNGYVLNDLKALVKGYGSDRVIAAMIESDGQTAKERVKSAERLLAPSTNGRAEHRPSKEEVHNAFE